MDGQSEGASAPISIATSSKPSQTPGPHASFSPDVVTEKPHGEGSSPSPPKSPMPPTASLSQAAEDLQGAKNGHEGANGSLRQQAQQHAAADASRAASLQAGQGNRGSDQSTSQIPSPPPEVEATLAKLTAHANVTGVLVLSRPEALVIRSGGSYFEPSGPGASDRAVRLKNVVTLVRNAVLGLERDVPKAEDGDELSFLRIRTKRYEMMISPSDKYLLVVLQDPTVSS